MAEQPSGAAKARVARRAVLVLVAGAALLSSTPALAQVSPEIQAETFAKIFRYDRKLGDVATVEVLFVHPDGEFDRWRDTIIGLARAFAQQRMSSRGIGAGDLDGVMNAKTVAYLLPGTTTPAVMSLVEASGALSIAADPSMAERGEVAVALGRERQGRAEIVVNKAVLTLQGHDLPAQMLRLARVVGTDGASAPSRVSSISYSAGDDGVVAPELVGFQRPPYPPLARRLGVEGTVTLRVLVDATGQVMEVEVQDRIPQDVGINEAASDAGWNARFSPGTKNGRPALIWTTMEVPFKL